MEWLRNIVAFSIALAMAMLFLYGVMRFPNSPIEPCTTGYCGKGGVPTTEEEYRAYQTWLGILVLGYPVGVLTLGVLWASYFFRK